MESCWQPAVGVPALPGACLTSFSQWMALLAFHTGLVCRAAFSSAVLTQGLVSNRAVGKRLLQQPWGSQLPWKGMEQSLGGLPGAVRGPQVTLNPHSSLPSSHWEQGLLCPGWVCTDKRGSCFLRRPKAHFTGGSSTCWGSAWSQCRV